MADETKKYIIDIESNLKEYADLAAEAKKKVEELTVANLKLQASDKATAAEKEASTAALKNANDEYRKAQSLLKTAIANNQSEVGSRKQLGEQLKLQEQALGKLGNAYIKDAQGIMRLNPAYTEQRNQIAATKQKILDYDAALKDGRSNIGRYGESLGQFFNKGKIDVQKYGEAVKGAFKENMAQRLMGMVGPMALVTAAITVGVKIFEKFKEAIMSTSGAMNAMNIVGQITKQMFYDVAVNGRLSAESMLKAAEAAKLMNEKRVGDRKDMVEFALLEREIAKLEFDAADKTKTRAERQGSLNLAIAKQNELSDKKVADAKEELKITQDLMILRPKDDKLKQQEAELITKIIKLDQERFDQSKRNQARLSGFEQEERDKLKAAYYKEIELQNEINDNAAAAVLKKKEDAEKAMIESKKNLEKEIEDYRKSILDKQQADIEAAEKKKQIILDQQEWERNQLLANQENLLAIREANYEWLYDTERARLEMQHQAELDNAEKTGADINIINGKYAALQRQIDEEEANAKLQLYAGFAGNLATIFGKNTALGKAAAIAETTINTYTAAMAAYKSLAGVPIVGPFLGIAAAAAATIAGIENVKKIMAVKVPGGGGGESAPSVSVPTSIAASAPAQRTFSTPVGSSVLTQPQLTQQQLNALPVQNLTADDIANAVSKLPAPRVSVEDINTRMDEVRKVTVRSNI
jgi:hypothetical protein